MDSKSSLVSRLPLVVAITSCVLGLLVSPIETAVLWGVGGYFLAKVAQSVIWTGLGDTRA